VLLAIERISQLVLAPCVLDLRGIGPACEFASTFGAAMQKLLPRRSRSSQRETDLARGRVEVCSRISDCNRG